MDQFYRSIIQANRDALFAGMAKLGKSFAFQPKPNVMMMYWDASPENFYGPSGSLKNTGVRGVIIRALLALGLRCISSALRLSLAYTLIVKCLKCTIQISHE